MRTLLKILSNFLGNYKRLENEHLILFCSTKFSTEILHTISIWTSCYSTSRISVPIKINLWERFWLHEVSVLLWAWTCSQQSHKKPLVLICFLIWCQLLLTHLLIPFQLPNLLDRQSLCNRWTPFSQCSSWAHACGLMAPETCHSQYHGWLFFSQLGYPRWYHSASAQRRRPAVSSVLLGCNFREGKNILPIKLCSLLSITPPLVRYLSFKVNSLFSFSRALSILTLLSPLQAWLSDLPNMIVIQDLSLLDRVSDKCHKVYSMWA